MTRFTTRAAGTVLVFVLVSACAISPQARYDRYVARGKTQLEKHSYTRAILEFQNAVKLKPKEAEAYYQIGLASEDSGDVRSAIAFFRKALDENPKHAGAQLKLAQFMVLTNDRRWLQDAQTRLTALKENSPTSTDVLNSLALAELKLGNTDSASEDLTKVLANAPQELTSSILLAQAKLRQHDSKGAEEVLKKACQSAPNSPKPRIALGEFYTAAKRSTEAEDQFRAALSIDPKNGLAMVELGSLQLSLGRKQDAEQNFKKAANFGEDRFKAVYGQYLFEQGRREEAIREFERLAKASPDDRAARTRVVAAYLEMGRIADAQRILGGSLRKNPKDLDALLQRAEISLQLHHYDEAEADLNNVIRLRPNSAEAHYIRAKIYRAAGQDLTYRQELSEALRLNPFLLAARLELAQSLILDKQPAVALETLDAAPAEQKRLGPIIVQRNWALWASGDLVEMRKGIDQGLSHEKSTDFLIQDGLWKLRTGNPSGARGALEEALKINPADVRALEGLSQTYVAQKQFAEALQKVKEYAVREPKSAPVQEFLGNLLLARAEREQARAAFMAAKAADSHFVDADLSLAEIDILDGRMDDARRRVQAISSTEGSSESATLWLANMDTMQGQQAAALAQYRKVVDAEPNNTQALNNLAYLLAEGGQQLDEALKFAQKAVELAPDNAGYRDTLGWVYYRKGLYPLAATELERAASKGDSALWRYHLAMAYIKAGDLNRGRASLQLALKRNPSLPEAKTAQSMLEGAK